MLDVRRLRILQHLAAYGTVAATADALHLTAPAVSQHLAALQKEAGTPVVEKHGRTLRLTAAGELLVAHTEVILAELAAAESGLAAMKGGRRGTVRISAFASAARTLVPPLFARLTGADPAPDNGTGAARDLSLRLSVQEPDEALDALHKRSTDLALVHSYTVLPRSVPAAWEQTVLMEEPVLLALHPDRAGLEGLTAGQPADLSRLAHLPWLTPGPETSCYEMIQRACGAAGFVPDIRASSSDFSVLTALAAADAGAVLVPRMALPDHTAPLSLHPLVRPVSRTVFTVSRAGTGKHPDLRAVLDLLHETARALDDRTAGRPR
ncbi:LysR family transcriptional regulator [Streptomyces olivochromogenes]|uniref:LysR family transcriptional regulator n=1 Tax=Streptomyces olivochromogenes TaxID=1963 RepID=A0A250VT30_STROL|nr:LysR family transcriptional regulator [Streptomyces olivochromogenes]KUN42497.1 LysR family transcriptional regulator [Streptomyces olivochromogenes]GAX57182.1 LysR family transcriptional regulator [Streptomyces olivochromogenes]